MIVALSFCIFAVICAYLGERVKLSQRKVIFIFLALILIAFVGTRANYTSDVYNYLERYDAISNYSFVDIWNQYITGEIKDGGFYELMYLCKVLGISFQTFLIVISSIYIIPVIILIYKKSENYVISVIIFLSLSWISFIMSGLRQSVAMGLCCLAMVIQFNKRKSILSLLLIGIAYLSHASALIFIIAYILVRFSVRISMKVALMMMGTSIIVAVIGQQFLRNMILFVSWNQRFEEYAFREVSLNWSSFLIQLGLVVFCYFLNNNLVDDCRKDIEILLSVATIGVVFQSFSAVVGEFFRISLYYSIVIVVILPMCLERYSKQFKSNKIKILAVSLLLLYVIVSPKYIGYTTTILGGAL